VHDDRDPQPPGGQVRRQCNIAAEADDHVCSALAQNGRRSLDCSPEPTGEPEQIDARPSRQRDRRDERQLIAALRNQPPLESALGPERGHLDRRVVPAQSIGGRESGLDVARRAATGEHDPH
jgi:hypothetical protein